MVRLSHMMATNTLSGDGRSMAQLST